MQGHTIGENNRVQAVPQEESVALFRRARILEKLNFLRKPTSDFLCRKKVRIMLTFQKKDEQEGGL